MSNSQRTLLESRRFTVVEETLTKPDGQTASLQYIKHPGSVAVLPMVDGDRVCLIHSRRLTVDKTLIELPAGTREPDESPRQTAVRELAEETGYRANAMEELATFYPSPGITDERIWIFVARGLTAGDPAREANEEIENFVVPWPDAMSMAASGEIQDAKTMLALLIYERRRNGAN
jgi:ADP-ribose pyrophosphatase